MNELRILIADDDPDIRQLIRIHLDRVGLASAETSSGTETIRLLQQQRFDLLILDLMMEESDGFDVLRHIRAACTDILVIVLSARRGEGDKIEALELGADDYVTKPFSPSELTARVQANLRRYRQGAANAGTNRISLNALVLDADNYMLYRDGEPIGLTHMEYEMIRLFMQNPDQVLTKSDIYKEIWKHERYDDNSLSVYMNRLRKKIERDPLHPQYLQTVRGIGYRFSGDGL